MQKNVRHTPDPDFSEMQVAGYQFRWMAYDPPVPARSATPWVAFHGFGQTVNAFAAWAAATGCRVYSFSLPGHHGTPSVPHAFPKEWAEAFIACADRLGLSSFHLTGFSIGCRPAATLALHMPDRVGKVLLIGPELFFPHVAYRVATGTKVGNWLLPVVARMIEYPAVRAICSRLLTIFGAAPLPVSFAEALKGTWLTFRRFACTPATLASLYTGRLAVVLAQSDPFTNSYRVDRAFAGLPKVCLLKPPGTTHVTLFRATLRAIRQPEKSSSDIFSLAIRGFVSGNT